MHPAMHTRPLPVQRLLAGVLSFKIRVLYSMNIMEPDRLIVRRCARLARAFTTTFIKFEKGYRPSAHAWSDAGRCGCETEQTALQSPNDPISMIASVRPQATP
jgi:hypothetical protein